jgi:hypothetical protein
MQGRQCAHTCVQWGLVAQCMQCGSWCGLRVMYSLHLRAQVAALHAFDLANVVSVKVVGSEMRCLCFKTLLTGERGGSYLLLCMRCVLV